MANPFADWDGTTGVSFGVPNFSGTPKRYPEIPVKSQLIINGAQSQDHTA